ncbi:GLPGLI family protein [Psychroserpens mesophilus]|uniref:GLPGLI family protein n=1 Tax=Psychroserpens mesophilus TaxID=325473 RepID=UPI003D6557E2
MFSIKKLNSNPILNFILIVLLINTSFSQNETLEVDYSSVLLDEIDDYGSFNFFDGKLITNGVKSVYSITIKDTIVDTEYFGYIDSSKFKFKNSFYKDPLRNQVIYYREKRGLERPKLIKDNYTIDWKLVDEYTSVLGFRCQKATCNFRGRSYEAFFTSELPYNDGPYKFDGLPGLILKVKSLDGALEIKATLVTNVEEDVPNNPYDGLEHTISFEDYKKLYKKYFNNMTGYRVDMDSEIFVPNRYIEFLIDE